MGLKKDIRLQNLAAWSRKGLLAKVFTVFVFIAMCSPYLAVAAKYEPLSQKKLEAALKMHCTLVLPWASWCPICLEELPLLLPALNQRPQIHPIVLDISRPYVQENFSRKFMEKLDLKYPTYRLPMESQEDLYRRLIDESWKGALPTAFLFTCEKGKCSLRKRWYRKINTETLEEIQGICNTKQ